MKNKRNKVMLLAGIIALITMLIFSETYVKAGDNENKYPFKLPALPYSYEALEPYIDTQTMTIHHQKHHQAYVDNLNKALSSYPDLQGKTLEELLLNLEQVPQEVREAVRNNGGGHYNHSFFWTIMGKDKGGEPKGKLKEDIVKSFGSFDNFKKEFKDAALKRFGSGWAWLIKGEDGKLKIISTPNQDSPIMEGITPILGIDVWEHAYYLKYQNKRGDYIDAWWNVVNWEQIEKDYK
ncbi:Fe-Mn family superoxide dismutase [Clostridium tunisiense]|uniref:superoxide dismutase n=1 Tax=Clostridium tunisiense TaxID=219748 RepID=UPI0002E2FE1D